MRKLLVANWKENPATEKKALQLFENVARAKRSREVEVVICPPSVYLEGVAVAARKMPTSVKKNLALGAQDVFWEERGAYTGEAGPKMLRSLGARYVIIGHSERRRDAKETDAMINRKIKAVLKDTLRPILCVGEPLAIRRKGLAAAQAYIKNQLKKDLAGIRGGDVKKTGGMAIAYEPIWAIGTGKNDKPEDARAVATFIRSTIATLLAPKARFALLYGGSVNSKNIVDYVQYREIDGALVGGASLKAGEFIKMIKKING